MYQIPFQIEYSITCSQSKARVRCTYSVGLNGRSATDSMNLKLSFKLWSQLQHSSCIPTEEIHFNFVTYFDVIGGGLNAFLPAELWKVGPEHDLLSSDCVCKLDELLSKTSSENMSNYSKGLVLVEERSIYRRIIFREVCRCVDKDIRMLLRYPNHLLRPWVANVSTNYGQRGKFQGNFVDILTLLIISRSQRKVILTGTGRPTSLGHRGPVCPTCVS